MQLKEYIKRRIKESKEKSIDFDIGVTTDMDVNNDCLNRIRFTITRKEK